MIEKKDRVQALLEDVELDKKMSTDAQVSSAETEAVNEIIDQAKPLLSKDVCMSSVKGRGVSPMHDPQEFVTHLEQSKDEGRFMCSVGSTDVGKKKGPLFEVDNDEGTTATEDETVTSVDEFVESLSSPLSA